ncbi:hypothetical protein GGI11_005011, partial [Coemansia sp. RSA 2049]
PGYSGIHYPAKADTAGAKYQQQQQQQHKVATQKVVDSRVGAVIDPDSQPTDRGVPVRYAAQPNYADREKLERQQDTEHSRRSRAIGLDWCTRT